MEILYNVTVHVEASVEEEWKDWMMHKHIPDVMATGKFTRYYFNKVLHQSEDGSSSYAIQYHCPSMDQLNAYQKEDAPALQAEHIEKYQQKCLAFRTLLEVIDTK